ncbi:MAG: hypothetical protein K2H06_00750 [Anaeroplasmataceae bacterium]|nr:hypothetical protein [Anaeroplasmataceae bacterium]
MYSDWIKVEQTSSSYDKYIATGPKTAKDSRSRYDFTIYNIPKLPKKGKLPFINISSIPVYAYITYTTTINGTDTTKRFILKYNYSDYVIESKTLVDNREKELNVSSTNIQWKYKNDISWTNSISIDDLIGIETRTTETHIQWKRKCDSEWTNLKAFEELSGYVSGKIPQVKMESGSVYWKYEENSSWNYLMSTSTLKSVDLKVNDGYIQWKRKNHTEWINLIEISKLPNYTPDKSITDNDVRVNGSNVQWRYSGTSSYTTLQTVDSLIGLRVQFDGNKNIQWKCVDESEWKNLMIDGEQATEANIDSTPIKYGPTAGGIE